ncbi:MAG TPA: hypothetical protein ENF48_05530 [Desulfobacteraceae bacterium]|nr:hypothetical protein [Deltaproteobacteria bacterium]HDI59800.1 hypothetical protein [Desulfobacteraceae bacterium]
MDTRKYRWMIGLLALVIMGGLLTACATTGKPTADAGIAPNITYQVADSAQVTKVAYYFKEYKGAQRLHMELTIKNVSTEVKRYRVHIFLPEGPAGGGLYPRKVKKDATGIAPGEELTRVFPMFYHQMPSGFTIVVKELG